MSDSEDEFFTEMDFADRANFIKDRQVFARRPKRARDVINTLMARKGYNQIEASDDLQLAWESVIDPRMIGKTRATKIKAGKLEVVVKSALLNQELTFNKSNLLEKIKDSPIGNRIKDIRFRVGAI
jgi:hypothetical protein